MRRILKKVLVAVNLFFASLLILTYISTHISPEYLWQITYLGLIYPYILAINIIFVLFWLVKLKKYVLISLIAILIGFQNVRNIFQLNSNDKKNIENTTEISVFTYNVRLFDHYNWTGVQRTEDKIFDLISSESPDVLCFQEFMIDNEGKYNKEYIENRLRAYSYSYINFTIEYKLDIGLAIYSKYPIIGHGFIQFSNSINQVVYTDLLVGPDTVRVYNAHLQSVGFAGKNYSVIDSLRLEYSEKQIRELKDISQLLKNAYIIRADQANTLANHVNACNYHKIVCGDFNDPPVSYAYRKISKNLNDAFTQAGNGFSYTYRRGVSAFRIDYILHSDFFKAIDYRRLRVPYSDHYPVMVRFVKN